MSFVVFFVKFTYFAFYNISWITGWHTKGKKSKKYIQSILDSISQNLVAVVLSIWFQQHTNNNRWCQNSKLKYSVFTAVHSLSFPNLLIDRFLKIPYWNGKLLIFENRRFIFLFNFTLNIKFTLTLLKY